MTRDDPAQDSIIIDCDLAEPPEKVWRALTEPALLAAWLMPNDIRPEVGHRFAFQGQPDASGAIACEVLAVEPNHLLRYSWRGSEPGLDAAGPLDTTVTFVLTGTASGGTHLRIVHSGFAPALQRPLTMLAGAGSALLVFGRGAPLQWRTIPGGLDGRPGSTGRTVMQSGMRMAA